MTITIPVTKILTVWVLSLGVCALCRIPRGEAKFFLLVATVAALVPLRRRVKPGQH